MCEHVCAHLDTHTHTHMCTNLAGCATQPHMRAVFYKQRCSAEALAPPPPTTRDVVVTIGDHTTPRVAAMATTRCDLATSGRQPRSPHPSLSADRRPPQRKRSLPNSRSADERCRAWTHSRQLLWSRRPRTWTESVLSAVRRWPRMSLLPLKHPIPMPARARCHRGATPPPRHRRTTPLPPSAWGRPTRPKGCISRALRRGSSHPQHPHTFATEGKSEWHRKRPKLHGLCGVCECCPRASLRPRRPPAHRDQQRRQSRILRQPLSLACLRRCANACKAVRARMCLDLGTCPLKCNTRPMRSEPAVPTRIKQSPEVDLDQQTPTLAATNPPSPNALPSCSMQRPRSA